VITLDIVTGTRRAVPMRWGFPDPKDWRRPRPIHARAETIETTRAFAEAFIDGQRGIVLMKSFNEAPDVPGPTQQHTITPEPGEILAAAFVWRKFEIKGAPDPFFACVLCTVPANELIAKLPTDRMPAFLAKEDWGTWLGEIPATLDEVKACLKTVEGVRWTMAKEGKRSAAGTRASAEVLQHAATLRCHLSCIECEVFAPTPKSPLTETGLPTFKILHEWVGLSTRKRLYSHGLSPKLGL